MEEAWAPRTGRTEAPTSGSRWFDPLLNPLLRGFIDVSYRGANLLVMRGAPDNARRSAQARDAAVLRLRRVTRLSIALMVAVGGIFTALAAGSTHAKKGTVARVSAYRVAPAAVLVEAPAPPLVGSQSTPAAPSEAPASAPAPAPAPAPTYQQPVVVSGGS